MRKLADHHAERQARIAANRLRASLRRKQHRTSGEVLDPLSILLHRKQFLLPRICSLDEKAIDVCLDNLFSMRASIEAGYKLMLDFSETTAITAGYGVYLYAELQSLIKEYGSGCLFIKVQMPTKFLSFVLRESGLLQLVNGTRLKAGSRGMMPIISGEKDDEIDVIINYIIKTAEINGHLASDVRLRAQAELLTSRAISEAMLNVDYHAYPDSSGAKLWWFTAGIYGGNLYISICDRGVGIHQTLPRADWWEIVMGGLPINDDGQMIQAAMAYTRTANKKIKGRGLGTKDIQNLVLERGRGHLTIISGRGHYMLDGSKHGAETIFKTKTPVIGTTIDWKIPIGISI